MSQIKVLCPELTDAQQFESDYAKHIEIFQKNGDTRKYKALYDG